MKAVLFMQGLTVAGQRLVWFQGPTGVFVIEH